MCNLKSFSGLLFEGTELAYLYYQIILIQCLKAQSKQSLQELLNEKDNTGCSPLHYASREGHIRSLENLIKHGAVINLKNNNNESPLHFAARYLNF